MKRKQVRLTRRAGIPVIFSVVLLIALTLSNVTQAAPLPQALLASNSLPHYEMTVDPTKIKLCVGQTRDFLVTVPLVVTDVTVPLAPNQATSTFKVYYAGEFVHAKSEYTIGSIAPPRLQTSASVLGGAELVPRQTGRRFGVSMVLVFTFTAEEKGTAPITFEHSASPNPRAPRAPTQTVQVEVVDCWETYASALAQQWPTKDICSLERPFLLAGEDPNAAIGITGSTDAVFFWPGSFETQLSTTGSPMGPYEWGMYVFVNHWNFSQSGVSVSCTDISGGEYEVILYPDRAEGTLDLYGDGMQFCDTGASHTVDDVGVQVAFKALGAGQVCKESLP
jgi:hypothetical protein